MCVDMCVYICVCLFFLFSSADRVFYLVCPECVSRHEFRGGKTCSKYALSPKENRYLEVLS